MKLNQIIGVIFSIIFFCSRAYTQKWINIQKGIDSLVKVASAGSDVEVLVGAIDRLKSDHEANRHPWASYWYSYAVFKRSVALALGDENSIKEAKNGAALSIDVLRKIPDKNSEEYALLAYVKGFTLQWVKGISIFKESKRAEKWANEAVILDPRNPRAYYVYGNHDYHVPRIAGGGRKARELLVKAIELFQNAVPHPIVPSWGMAETYAALAKVYIKEKDFEKSKKILSEGLSKFPDHRDLMTLSRDMK